MLIHFAVCGIGLGHISRSIVVADELVRRGHTVTFSAYDQAYQYLVKHGYSPAKVHGLSYGVGGDGGISVKQTVKANIFLPVKFMLQTAEELSIIKDVGAELVLSDTRASAVLAAKILGKPVISLLNQYNLPLEVAKYRRLASIVQRAIQAPQTIWNMSNKIIVPDLPPPYTISEATLNIPEKQLGKTLFTGPLIGRRFLSDEELLTIKKKHGAEDRPLVLVVISGGRAEKQVLIEKILSMAHVLSGRFSYVLSVADPSSTGCEKIGQLTVHRWVEDLDQLIMAADVVVGRGGLTLISKCIAYGKRMVLIPTPYHGEQRSNVQKAFRLGLCEKLEQSNLNHETFEETIAKVIEDKEMGRRVNHLREVALGLGGVQKVADVVEELLNVS